MGKLVLDAYQLQEKTNIHNLNNNTHERNFKREIVQDSIYYWTSAEV